MPDSTPHLSSTIFIDKDPEGCRCTPTCPTPCWQRVGLTDKPCCNGCPPLPDPDTL